MNNSFFSSSESNYCLRNRLRSGWKRTESVADSNSENDDEASNENIAQELFNNKKLNQSISVHYLPLHTSAVFEVGGVKMLQKVV